ncbi:right-handed parallel beta-helix repeat-containing protein [Candidatus Bipolaricaulota bacterium]
MRIDAKKFGTLLIVGLILFVGLAAIAGPFDPITVTDHIVTAPLANPVPSSYQPRYISGFGSGDSFTILFEDRDAANTISYVSTISGPTGFPGSATATNIADTHFVVKDWPINVAGIDYAYRGWGAVGNNVDHHFYVSNDLTTWVLVSTFIIPNAPGFADAHGWVYYGFHDVIELNGTYYAFAESNQSQTMLVRSANGDDVWEAFASVGGRPGWGPLELPADVSYGWTPSGSFVDLGRDRGYGKIHVDPRDSNLYLAVNTTAKASLPPAELEAAFIDPGNWAWHDGTAGPAANPILSQTAEHDLRECWVALDSDPDAEWIILYDADFGSADGGKALGYATLSPPPPPPEIVWVDDDYCDGAANDGHTWGYDTFDNIQEGIDAVAGSTVHVAAGEYTPASTLVIDKDNLILQGPQADVDPRFSYGSTRIPGSLSEAVIDGSIHALGRILYVDADNVIINGLEVKSGTEDMIRQSNPHSGTVVKYCMIHDGRGDEGVQLKKATHAVLEYNYVFEIAYAGDGLNIADGSSDGVIRYNEVAGIHGENAAIYIYDAVNMEIIGNLVRDSGTGGNDGIKIGAKGGVDAAKRGVLVKDNIIHDIAQDGVSVYMSDVTVEGNEIFHCDSENGIIHVAYAVTDITIRGNTVRDNTLITSKFSDAAGILIRDTVDVANVTVEENRIFNNIPYGLTNHAAGTLNAENNWWGSVDRPEDTDTGTNEVTLATCGSYSVAQMLNSVAEISGSLGDKVSSNVDYCPWLTSSSLSVEFAEFTIGHALIDFKDKPNDDKARVQGTLELDLVGGDNVDVSEEILVTVGSLSETVTMVEKGKKGDRWEYKRPKGDAGAIKHLTIDWKNGRFDIHIDKADLSGATNPLLIGLQIGDDVGSVSISMSEKKSHWDYTTHKPKALETEPVVMIEPLRVVAYPNPIRDVHTATFQVMGSRVDEVDEIRVAIFDLSGHLVWEDAAAGSELDWHTDSLSGDYLANGIYLYRVLARVDGNWIVQETGRIAVLR